MDARKVIRLPLLMVVGALCASGALAARVVDRLDDPSLVGISACTPAPNDCNLRGAVESATNGSQITFDPSLNGQTITVNGGISIIAQNLNIQGPGASLLTITDPSSNLPVFTVVIGASGTQMSGLTIANSGGGIEVDQISTTATFSGMVFNNIQQRSGGIFRSAIYNGGTTTVTNCTFTNNSSYTGANPNSGPAIANGGSITLSNSTFSGNHSANSGGAIANDGSALISNSTFTNNTADGLGGAIVNQSTPAAQLTLVSVTMTGNSANSGGAVYGNVQSFGLTAKIRIANSFFGGNTASVGGAVGGLQATTIINSTFSGNHASNRGGAIDLNSGFTSNTVFLRHLTVTQNVADSQVGGISVGAAPFSLANSIVTGNSAPTAPDTNISGSNNIVGGNAGLGPLGTYGGGTQNYALQCGSPAIDAGSNAFSTDDNSSPLASDQRGQPRSVGAAVDIGAVESANSAVSNALDAGAGSLRDAVANTGTGSTVCFDPTFFATPRVVTVTGGSIFVPRPMIIPGPGTGLLTLDANSASGIIEIAPGAGGTVALSGMTLTRGATNLGGAGIKVTTGTANVSNVAITNCDVFGAYAGGIYNLATLNLTDSTISGCSAGLGGAIGNDGTATLTRVTLSGNTAIDGGGVANFGTFTVSDSTLLANHATRPSGSGSPPRGGGIFCGVNTTLNVLRSSLISNTAQLGGGILSFGYSNIINSTFNDNHAFQTGNGPTADGAAFYGAGNYTGGSNGVVDVGNTTVVNNSAINSGGGFFLLQSGTTHLMNSVNNIFASNFAANGPDISGSLYSYGNNLIGNNSGSSFEAGSPVLTGNIVGTAANPVDPRLAPIGNYGGPTQTMLPFGNSPVINAGRSDFIYTTDQRGQSRPVAGVGDIGAVERSISVTQTTLPNAVPSVFYNQQLTASRLSRPQGGKSPMLPNSWSILPLGGESLPPGITLSPAGVLSGFGTQGGTYNFTVKVTDADGMAGIQKLAITVLVPTAANVTFSGRVITSLGSGLRGARVVITMPDGTTQASITNSFGYYSFEGIAAGTTIVVSLQAKGYRFAPQIVTLVDTLTGYDLVASP